MFTLNQEKAKNKKKSKNSLKKMKKKKGKKKMVHQLLLNMEKRVDLDDDLENGLRKVYLVNKKVMVPLGLIRGILLIDKNLENQVLVKFGYSQISSLELSEEYMNSAEAIVPITENWVAIFKVQNSVLLTSLANNSVFKLLDCGDGQHMEVKNHPKGFIYTVKISMFGNRKIEYSHSLLHLKNLARQIDEIQKRMVGIFSN
jgi:hypothetical protein